MILSIDTKGHRWEAMMNQLSASLRSVVCLSLVAECSSQQCCLHSKESREVHFWRNTHVVTREYYEKVVNTRLPVYLQLLQDCSSHRDSFSSLSLCPFSKYLLCAVAAQCATLKRRHKRRLYRFCSRILRLTEIVWHLNTMQGISNDLNHSRRLAELLMSGAEIYLPPCPYTS